MGYVATRGGEEAILNAEALFRAMVGPVDPELVRHIATRLPYLVDRLMGEGSLYDPELAALALAQTGGDLYEAILLLRAYRSTQPRLGNAEPVRPQDVLTVRRVSASFKDIPGGQVLGPTLDYSHRLLALEALRKPLQANLPPPKERVAEAHPPSVAEWLRGKGLLPNVREEQHGDVRIPDLTREHLEFPAPRAHRLQALARADTSGLLALAYANMRGYGAVHPTVNEVRLGYALVKVRHPVTGEAFAVGRVRLSQAEVVAPRLQEGERPQLVMGFSATLGWNEVKVISGAVLDIAMDRPEPHPSQTEEFVLRHTEPVEASGFCIHYKLPHYVMFSSLLERLETVQGVAAEVSAEGQAP